ncbi:MAG: bifunctional glutamate N-acetyltransferase/amino-acid acetyltransferase ArgJ [Lentisphaeria bacterium]|nr:bifunctional glutamate N-acetyltransferase/amino-acid acetyltransferase ArgJ [Lentisphaeria bacterium]
MKNEPVFLENGSVTSPAGFQASGVACGLKKSGNPDFAMLFSEHPCNFAGTFTSNLFPAAPVQLCRERCANRETVRAVVVNSGIANACTGQTGYQGAVKMAEMTAGVLGIEPEDVLVSSTGRIGVQLPLEKIANGIRMAADALSSDGGAAASSAIITTDTRPKTTAVSFEIDGRRVTIGGMTKGAGMIAPRMLLAKPHATMLCYITTDAVIDNRTLGCWLEDAVDKSFNRITVDNDMSTNDTCLIFANGASGVKISAGNGEDLFRKSLVMVVQYLAKNMVMDGEGTTKMISVEVTGAASESDARLCAKAIADSMLCKTAWFGNDPNWGRVVAALGYSGAEFDPAKCNIYYDGTPVVRNGGDAGTPEADLLDVVKKREFVITCDFGEGDGEYWVWSSDLSHEYVTINADYHT